MVKREIIEIILKFRKAVEEKGIEVSKIVIFGSVSGESFGPDSDIDVAVVSGDFGRDRFEEGKQLFQIASKIDPRIEPIPISIDKFENENWIPIIHAIKSTGIEL